MTKHLFRLVWNRKKANLLLVVEIFIAFVVLFAVTLAAVWAGDGFRRPLGFERDRLLTVHVRVGFDAGREKFASQLEDALRIARAQPEVEGVSAVMSAPYSTSTWLSDIRRGSRPFRFQENFADDAFADVARLTVTRGRWFSREDDAATTHRPAVLNERLAREIFGEADPVGQQLEDAPEELPPGETFEPRRVVGVVSDYRKDGEISPPLGYVFNRVTPKTNPMPRSLVVRVAPGTPPAFEETLTRALQRVDPSWSVVVKPVSELRATSLKLRLAPLALLALVGLFLLLMVVLGLTGVVWENVTRRTREIGLRRAKGSTAAQVVLLVVGEVLVVTAFGVAPALVLLLQVPLLGALPAVPAGLFLSSLALSAALMFALTALCALPPARMTLRLSPAEALRDE